MNQVSINIQELNEKIRDKLYETQFGVVSDTMAKGVFCLRACNVSYRSRYEDFDNLFTRIKHIGTELTA